MTQITLSFCAVSSSSMDRKTIKFLTGSTFHSSIFHPRRKGKLFVLKCKWLTPPCTRHRTSDAIDVDNLNDYKEMVKKISDDCPPVVRVFVDMRHIEKLPRVSQAGGPGSGDDSEPTTDSSTVCTVTGHGAILTFTFTGNTPLFQEG